jgi:twitching motility two-component system response regulator PilH
MFFKQCCDIGFCRPRILHRAILTPPESNSSATQAVQPNSANLYQQAPDMTTILVVEDSPTQRAIVVEYLKKRGLTVIEAVDGVAAMEVLKSRSCPLPHLILLDIIMPRMNGYDFCRWVKNTPQTRHIPVVMCTSKGQASERYWGRKQGADAYLVKPVMTNELIGTMKQLLERSHGVVANPQPTSEYPDLEGNWCAST